MLEWDQTADMMAWVGNLKGGKYQRADFHPLRKREPIAMVLDDPAAEYERLTKGKGKCK